jgi:outer membrane protein OmpA-like peptidoglycan-associated protein
MNRRKAIVSVLWLTCALALVLAGRLGAQEKAVTDLTGQLNLTPEEIIQGLAERRALGRPTIRITVLFAPNSAAISPRATRNLNSLGTALQSPDLSPYPFQIEGYTDGIGSDQYNLGLSDRRAKSVKQYLLKNFRIPSERLTTVGRGKSDPIADNDTPEGREKNRRVEIVKLDRK